MNYAVYTQYMQSFPPIRIHRNLNLLIEVNSRSWATNDRYCKWRIAGGIFKFEVIICEAREGRGVRLRRRRDGMRWVMSCGTTSDAMRMRVKASRSGRMWSQRPLYRLRESGTKTITRRMRVLLLLLQFTSTCVATRSRRTPAQCGSRTVQRVDWTVYVSIGATMTKKKRSR